MLVLTTEQRRALQMLADAPNGCTEPAMRARGFSVGLLAGLVAAGLAVAKPDTMNAAADIRSAWASEADYSWSTPFRTQRSRKATTKIHAATITGTASSERVPPSNAMKSRLVTVVHRRYRPRTDTGPRRLCARDSPGERGKTNPRGCPRSHGRRYGLHRRPEACTTPCSSAQWLCF
jgi:hypothetical protein